MRTRRGVFRAGGAMVCVAMALFACAPQDVASKITERAAESVVKAAIKGPRTETEADSATRCILRSASPEEQRALARDVGAYAGTTTLANVRTLLARPATQDCQRDKGLPEVRA